MHAGALGARPPERHRERQPQPSRVRKDREGEAAQLGLRPDVVLFDELARLLDEQVVADAGGHAVTHAMQPRQRSMCSTTDALAVMVPSASPRMSQMRPRGRSASIWPSGPYVGHVGRRSQWVQASMSSRSIIDPRGQVARSCRARAPVCLAGLRSADARDLVPDIVARAARRRRAPRGFELELDGSVAALEHHRQPLGRWRRVRSAPAGTAGSPGPSPRHHRGGEASPRRPAPDGGGLARQMTPSVPREPHIACRGRSRRRSSDLAARARDEARPPSTTGHAEQQICACARTGSCVARGGRRRRTRRSRDRRLGRARASVRVSAKSACNAESRMPASTVRVRSPASCSSTWSRPRRSSCSTAIPSRTACATSETLQDPASREDAGDGAASPDAAWEELSGVGNAGRVEGAPQTLHRLEIVLGNSGGIELRLVRPHAVLAGDRAAGVHARHEDRVGQLARSLGLALDTVVVEHERMEVPSPAWKTLPTRRPCSASSLAISRSTSGSFVRGTTPSWT